MPMGCPGFAKSSCLVVLAAAALAGCAGLGERREKIAIDSDPRGARIYVSGREVGVTPASLDLDEVFPRRWTNRIVGDEEGFAIYRRLETIELRKEGCENFSRRYVGDEFGQDIRVTLKCDPNYKPAPPAAPAGAPAQSVEQRLRAIEKLKQDGLINEEEYRAQRQRILNSL